MDKKEELEIFAEFSEHEARKLEGELRDKGSGFSEEEEICLRLRMQNLEAQVKECRKALEKL